MDLTQGVCDLDALCPPREKREFVGDVKTNETLVNKCESYIHTIILHTLEKHGKIIMKDIIMASESWLQLSPLMANRKYSFLSKVCVSKIKCF